MSARNKLARYRALVAVITAATFLAACSSTNSKDADTDDEAIAAPSTSASAPRPVPTGANGKPLTKQQIATLVKQGKLPKSALAAASNAPSSTTGGSTTGTSGTTGTTGTTAKTQYSGRIGPGITSTRINIGITLFKIGGVAKGFGSDADPGDTQAQAQAAVDYVNAHGGIAGRQINPIYYTFDLARPGLQDGQSEQEACAKWTQDNKVFFALNMTFSRLSILECLAKADVPAMHDGLAVTKGEVAKYQKYWYTQSNVTFDRVAADSTNSFCKRGFFAKDAKVGIQYLDLPSYKYVVDNSYMPALKACGVPADRVVLQAAPRGGTDGSQYAATFKAAGVTNVMFLGEASLYPLFFMRGAEQQQYRPKYGLSTAQTPALLLQDLVPKEQLANAMAIGWLPTADVDAEQDPGPVSKTNQLCMDIERRAGQDMSNRQAAFQSAIYCGTLLWLQLAMSKSTGLNSDALLHVVDSGAMNSFVSPSVFGAGWTAGKHDGPNTYRDYDWKNSAGKSKYTSGNKPLA